MTLEEMRIYFAGGATRPLSVRKTALANLKRAIERHEPDILRALAADLGKPEFEAYTFEVAPVLQELDTMLKHLGDWTCPQKVKTPLLLFSGSTEVRTEPYGLVLLMSPWNYPFYLLMMPLIGAVACGNVVAAKPSRRSPETTRLMRALLAEVFPEVWVSVFSEVNLDEAYDYIFFTGGSAAGKVVAEAAARHLTPVTLELGGKNPCIVDESADLSVAAKRIAWGKWTNAGQTCVAPDYLLVHDAVRDILIDKIAAEITAFYGENPTASHDYGKIVTAASYDRLLGYCTQGRVLRQCGMHNPGERRLAPVMLSASPGDPVTHAEIFGPVLPVITWRTRSDLRELVTPTPLALYIFTRDTRFADQLIACHPAGGVCINDVMLQVANKNAPFGGVGTSGMGCYHGRYSIDTFSRKQTVVWRKYSPDPALRYPPYTNKAVEKIRKWRKRLL